MGRARPRVCYALNGDSRTMSLRLVAPVVLICAAAPLSAAPGEALLEAMRVPEIVQVMREEGLDYAQEMGEDLLPGGATRGWRAVVSQVYDTEAMEEVVRGQFIDSFAGTEAGPLLDFFTSEDGQRVVDLEITARRTLIDDDLEASAREAYQALDGTDDPRLEQIEAFVEANDLVEANVVGAMNASYQFYLGLVDGGAFEMTEEEILSEVWAQEEDTRSDTREWLYAFLLVAYRPLSDAVLDEYVALSASPEGRAMNRALFAGFNAMYDEISYGLGLAAAQQMLGEEL
ncbi:hypothetical protein SAMN04487993_100974 [Salipiger marinus]|uniref:DUF2059 domain-containing protein n=2 Tax=Salipiger marinus TaxID=555512 RepID=A0A1G8N034_9RHOB|nr:hypothetical protein SAMN04487993_100974 [Salipiger marinus]